MNNGSNCGLTNDKSSACESILKQYCTANINDTFCQTTFKNDYPGDYADVMATTCLYQNDAGQYPWLTNPNCIAWMNGNPLATTTLQDFCADKSGNSTYNNICGCYYPQSVYTTFFNQLSSKYNIPPGYQLPQCGFPTCTEAQIHPPMSNPCPSENFLSCINIANINNDGTIGNVTLNQSNTCDITTIAPTPAPAPAPTGCSADSDCYTNKVIQYLELKQCSNGTCSYNKKFLAIIIATSLIIVVAVVAIIVMMD